MASIDLTRIFLQLRSSASSAFVNFGEDDNETLLQNDFKTTDMNFPKWINVNDELNRKNESHTKLITQLKSAQESYLSTPLNFEETDKQRFDDNYELCLKLSELLMSNLTWSERKLKEFDNFRKKNSRTLSYREKSMMQNVHNSHVEILQTRTSEFTKQQNSFKERLDKKNLLKTNSINGPLKESSTFFSIDDSEPSEDTIQRQMMLDKSIEIREAAIGNVQKDVYELNVLFKEVAKMVVEQGSVLDRIDYNIDLTADRVEQGHEELVKAREYQKKNKKICVIMTEAGIVLFLFLLLVFRNF